MLMGDDEKALAEIILAVGFRDDGTVEENGAVGRL